MSNLRHTGVGQALVKSIMATNGSRSKQITRQVDQTEMKTLKDNTEYPSKFSANPTKNK